MCKGKVSGRMGRSQMRTCLVGHRRPTNTAIGDPTASCQLSKETTVRNSFVRNPLSVITLAALTLPVLGHADCVPTAPVGYSVPFHMVSLESFSGSSNPSASYSDGQLTYMAHSELFRGTIVASTNSQQLFSNRTYCRGKFLDCSLPQYIQPFDIDQAGKISVSVSDGAFIDVFPPRGDELVVSFDGKDSYSGTCNSTSGELYVADSDHMYVITFGTPTPPPPPPPPIK